ncbi:hypothetical protein A3759_15300 [Thalassolituus sp. HI0120]|nr:hypothetical protein A3759_15300 [Thalassolituus sp. HI0120]
MNSAFDLQLSHPAGPLANVVQGIWSASVCASEAVEKTLLADACSGIALILAGDVVVDGEPLQQGVVMLPINKQTDLLVMKPGSILAGFRFHPAMGYKILGRHYDELSLLPRNDDNAYQLYELFDRLQQEINHDPGPVSDNSSQNDSAAIRNRQRVQQLYRWAEQALITESRAPDSIQQILSTLNDAEALTELSDKIGMSQRQIERLFKLRLGITAKNYQRIIRIRKAIRFIQANSQMPLADVAVELGFSDQAHMTREFKAIAKITPGKLSS